jgi:hypothetical protein
MHTLTIYLRKLVHSGSFFLFTEMSALAVLGIYVS